MIEVLASAWVRTLRNGEAVGKLFYASLWRLMDGLRTNVCSWATGYMCDKDKCVDDKEDNRNLRALEGVWFTVSTITQGTKVPNATGDCPTLGLSRTLGCESGRENPDSGQCTAGRKGMDGKTKAPMGRVGFPESQEDLIRQGRRMEVLWPRGGLGSWEAGLIAEGHPGGNLRARFSGGFLPHGPWKSSTQMPSLTGCHLLGFSQPLSKVSYSQPTCMVKCGKK